MSSGTILLVTWLLVVAVIGGYIWFVVWRVRLERRRKAAEAAADASAKEALQSFDAPPVAAMDEPPSGPIGTSRAEAAAAVATAATAADTAPAPASTPTSTPTMTTPTVAQALAGIQLPADLAPLTTMALRPGAGDRVAFWTDTTPAEVVGPAFADELERLGYAVDSTDASTLQARRDGIRLTVVMHPEGLLARIGDDIAFPSVPERSCVVEIWVPE